MAASRCALVNPPCPTCATTSCRRSTSPPSWKTNAWATHCAQRKTCRCGGMLDALHHLEQIKASLHDPGRQPPGQPIPHSSTSESSSELCATRANQPSRPSAERSVRRKGKAVTAFSGARKKREMRHFNFAGTATFESSVDTTQSNVGRLPVAATTQASDAPACEELCDESKFGPNQQARGHLPPDRASRARSAGAAAGTRSSRCACRVRRSMPRRAGRHAGDALSVVRDRLPSGRARPP
jgi:hypothetical protein